MPGLADLPGDHEVIVRVPGQATPGTANVWPILQADRAIRVTGVRWIPDAAVTGADTNNFALAVQNRGTAGSSTTAVTTTKTYASGTNSVQADGEDFTLHATEANRDLTAGQVLALVRTVNGTGLASPAGSVQVKYILK